MTWEQAKTRTQAMELRIAALIPEVLVVSVDQNDKGGLFSCDETRHRWKGITRVILASGADAEAVTRQIEGQFNDDGAFDVTNYRDVANVYVAELRSRETDEGYLFGEGDPGVILIDSWSACFTLPEGTYPGGDF
ncbi:hypothetical protein [Microbacterium sp. LWO12-1.2]|uniref:hypothetical protein n=1 Tax=Microbacterium sp. LWO12-1.2 TaxID=3135261 RepID=UPI0034182047